MMNLRIASIALAAAAICAAPAAAQDGERLFYYVDNEAAYASLVANIDRIDVVAASAYYVEEDGVVWGDLDARVLTLAREHGIRVIPLLVNRGFNQEELHTLLTDAAARARVAASLAELCRRHGYDGIQIDFENLSINDRDAFTAFYRETADALRSAGCGISVAVVHRPDELPGPTPYHKWLFDSWRGGYDLRALGEIGDFISIMSYSQHTRRTPPGPQAGIPWVNDVVEYFLRYVPAGKLSLGIPVGSQHWYTSYEERITPELARSYSAQLSHSRAMGLIERYGAEVQWNDEHQVGYAFFPVGGTFEWIFLEDARSFRAKLDLMRRHGLRGFSAWVLGPEDPAIWEALPRRTARGSG
ncbi:MAG: glycosyl hydrolase family 18 protein [Longimicrobiales bacterium]